MLRDILPEAYKFIPRMMWRIGNYIPSLVIVFYRVPKKTNPKEDQYSCHPFVVFVYHRALKFIMEEFIMKTKKKNRFLTFCFSCLPGAAEMYMGFMKMGVSLMLLFFLVCILSAWLNQGALVAIAVVVWFYSFFHANHLAGLSCSLIDICHWNQHKHNKSRRHARYNLKTIRKQ